MARGRRPKPEAVREQLKPVRSVRQEPAEAKAEVQAVLLAGVRPPSWVDGEALELWNQFAPPLQAARLLTAADVGAFARYCVNFVRWLDKIAKLKGGETYQITTASGVVDRAKPEFLIADRLERMLMAVEDRFGLNPMERQRIMAARAQTGVNGDLFPPDKPEGREDDPAAKATAAAMAGDDPIGLLN